jgi:uncharacterized protein (TIGR02246 family)
LAQKYTELWNKGDSAGLAQLVTEDYQNIPAGQPPVKGRAAFEAMEKTEAASRQGTKLALSVTTDFVRWINADAASGGGTYAMAGVPKDGGPDKGTWLGVFIKEKDGQWRMANGLTAAVVPPPPPPPPAKVAAKAPVKGKKAPPPPPKKKGRGGLAAKGV